MKYLRGIVNLLRALCGYDGDYIAKCWGWLARELKYDISRIWFAIEVNDE